MKIEQQNQILGCMNDVLNQNGFPRGDHAEGRRTDHSALRGDAGQGKVAKDVVIEACFIPMQLPAEDMGTAAVLRHSVSGCTGKQQGAAPPYARLLNNFCALGSFGFFEEAG